MSRLSRLSSNRFLFFFPALLLFYTWIAWLTSTGSDWLDLSRAAGFLIFSGDDAYRYFLARQAWLEPDIYAQGFVLPAALILDGLLAVLLGDSLFLMRCAHALLVTAALYLFYQAGIRLGIRPVIMAISIALLALMPLFLFVSLSFYGEFWLAWLLMVAVWGFATGRLWVAVFCLSLSPLVRPEGLAFLFFVALWLTWKRNYWHVIVLGLPGLFFAAYLLLSFGSLSTLSDWRNELRDVLGKIIFSNDPWVIFDSFSWLWLLPAALALFKPLMAPVWAMTIANAYFFIVLVVLIVLNKADYESRYVAYMLPLITLCWAWTVNAGWNFLEERKLSPTLPKIIAVTMGLWIGIVHLGQVTSVHQVLEYRKHLGKWPEFQESNLITAIFGRYSAEMLDSERRMASLVHQVMNENKDVDTVVVANTRLFYFLDPRKLPDDVTVGYPATFWPFFLRLLDGQLMAVFPNPPRRAYYTLNPPSSEETPKLLYAENIGDADYPYKWQIGDYELYLFDYEAALESGVDFRQRPQIDPYQLLR